jgi:hypothetical protein
MGSFYTVRRGGHRDEEATGQNSHPMHALAQCLGTEYPPPSNYRFASIVLWSAPVGILCLCALLWHPGAPFFLTFAGAFASIQLAEPYARAVEQYLRLVQEAGESGSRRLRSYLAVLARFVTRPSRSIGFSPVGYSPVGRCVAGWRFLWLVRRWGRCFDNMSMRVVMPGERPTPAALVRDPERRCVRNQPFAVRYSAWFGRRIQYQRWWIRSCVAIAAVPAVVFSSLFAAATRQGLGKVGGHVVRSARGRRLSAA